VEGSGGGLSEILPHMDGLKRSTENLKSQDRCLNPDLPNTKRESCSLYLRSSVRVTEVEMITLERILVGYCGLD
jgi:hypothetical protein